MQWTLAPQQVNGCQDKLFLEIHLALLWIYIDVLWRLTFVVLWCVVMCCVHLTSTALWQCQKERVCWSGSTAVCPIQRRVDGTSFCTHLPFAVSTECIWVPLAPKEKNWNGTGFDHNFICPHLSPNLWDWLLGMFHFTRFNRFQTCFTASSSPWDPFLTSHLRMQLFCSLKSAEADETSWLSATISPVAASSLSKMLWELLLTWKNLRTLVNFHFWCVHFGQRFSG